MQLDEPFEIVGQFRAMFGKPVAKQVSGRIMGVAHMGDAMQGGKGPAVVDQPADRYAPEAHAMIATLAPDQPRARSLADRALIGERDLERGVHRFRTRSGEEYPIETARRDVGQALGEAESERMAQLKTRRIVKIFQLGRDRRCDLLAPVPGIDAP